MSATPSTMKELGTPAPDFALPDTAGAIVSKNDFAGSPLLVAFICNHCPYVSQNGHQLGGQTAAYAARGRGVVLISSNDIATHPEDAPSEMPAFIREFGISVPYLFDESQEVAKAYEAACTPDFFLFDSGHTLVYRGQFDGARPGNDQPITGADLSAAVDAILNGEPPLTDQQPSMGCNIKWKPGNEPAFFTVG